MATWPTSIPTDANLYVAVNELQTNLSSGINNSVTTLTINSTTSFPTVGLVLIDNEIIKYTGVAGNDLTGCTRGFDGTSAASHSSAAIVSFAICANHHNVLKDEIIALATYLSNNLGTGAQPLSNGSRALASNGSGKIVESSVTSTELGYLSGVSSAIQTQLNLKAPLASPTFSGTVTTPVTADRALQTGTAGVLEASAVTKTELGYVSGVTSAIQTQLNAAVANPLTSNLAAGSHKLTGLSAGTAAGDSLRFEQMKVVQIINMSTAVQFSTTSGTFTSTNVTASITPTSSSNKVLVMISGKLQLDQSTVAQQCFITIDRAGTNLGDATQGFGFVEGQVAVGAADTEQIVGIMYLDSPATTSSRAYTVQIRTTAGNTGYFPKSTVPCSIFLVEVVA